MTAGGSLQIIAVIRVLASLPISSSVRSLGVSAVRQLVRTRLLMWLPSRRIRGQAHVIRASGVDRGSVPVDLLFSTYPTDDSRKYLQGMQLSSSPHGGVNLHILINLTTTSKMGQFEPLQNDLILRAAWGKSESCGQILPMPDANIYHRPEG